VEKKFKKGQKIIFIPSEDRWVGTYDFQTFTYIEKLDNGENIVINSNGQHTFRTENLWSNDYEIDDKVRVVEDVQIAKNYLIPLPTDDLKVKLLRGDGKVHRFSAIIGKVQLKVDNLDNYYLWWVSLAQITKLGSDKTSNFCIECGLLNEYGETDVCGLCKSRTKAFGF